MSSDSSNDVIHRFLIEQSDIRGEIVTLEHSFKDARVGQNIPPSLQALFGEFLAGATLISEILKFDGIVTLQARGDGIVPIIMSEANHDGSVRGVVSTTANANYQNNDNGRLKALPELLGNGVLSLTLDPSEGQRYQGIVPLDGANLSECLMHYFQQSEQIPTFLVLFANEDKCGGLFLQCLPQSATTDSETREEQWETVTQLANTLKEDEFFNEDHQTLLFRLFHDMGCRMFDGKALKFKCSCSRERSLKALVSLGEEEIQALIKEGEAVNIDCQFCGTNYAFSIDELSALLGHTKTLH